jgi:hypothetical protein
MMSLVALLAKEFLSYEGGQCGYVVLAIRRSKYRSDLAH